MSIDEPDEDDDVRKMLGADSRQTSARHDEAVLSAARAFASDRQPRARRWLPAWAAAAAGVAIVGVALWLGSQREERAQDPSAPQLVASVVLSAGMVRGGGEPVPRTARVPVDCSRRYDEWRTRPVGQQRPPRAERDADGARLPPLREPVGVQLSGAER